MEKKIIDILENLETNIDLTHIYELNQLKPSDIVGKTTSDVRSGLFDANIGGSKHTKVYKNKKKNIDGLSSNKKTKDINLLEKPRKYNIIKSYITAIKLLIKNFKRKKESIKNSVYFMKNELNSFEPEKQDIIEMDRQLIEINDSTKNNDNILEQIDKPEIIEIQDYPVEILNTIDIKNEEEIEEKTIIIDLENQLQKGYIYQNFIFTKKFFLYAFLLIVFLFIIMLFNKNIVEKKINSGYEKLLSIKENSGNIELIKTNIEGAKQDFDNGILLFTPFRLIPIQDVKNGYNVLKGGQELTNILEKGLKIYDGSKQFILDSGGIENIKLTNLLYNIKGDFGELMFLLYNTIIYYENIKDLPNENLNNKLEYAKSKLISAYKFLDIINKDYDVFLSLLGHNTERKYLIVFQNNDEIRPTGGFIGSLATVIVRNGKVINFQKEDVYSYEWDINKVMKEKELAPEGLNKITETFGFRDSNYFISFEASANSMKSFIDKVNRQVDGIVFINQNTILDFLKYTGGIKFNQLNETISEENFSLIISTLVEAKVFKVGALGTPKQVLFDFANVFINILKEKKDYYAYLDIIIKNIKSRDLVLYSFKPEENNLLWKLGLNGKINYLETLDFAYPVYTSVGGNKSDRYIELKYKKNITRNEDCSIDTNLNIYRTHMFSKTEEQKVNELLEKHGVKDNKTNLINIQGKGDNKSYTRVLLPKKAIIEHIEGMNIQQFDTFQQVDFYQTTRLLESTHFDINYKIPNPNCEIYSYKLYKQPGIRDFDIEIKDEYSEVLKEISIGGDYLYEK